MPTVFMDSFDHYSTSDIGKKWTAGNSGAISAGNGRGGSASVRWSGSQNGPEVSVANLVTVYAGFAFRMQDDGMLSDALAILRLLDGGSIQLDMCLNTDNFIMVKRGGTSVVATAGTGALAAGSFYHIESRFTLHPTVGSCEVRVNGTVVLNATGLNLVTSGNVYCNTVMLLTGGGTSTYDFDDFWITTDAFLGDCRVIALLPQGPGNYSQWTPSAGLGWQCVDEASMNGDTDYVSSGTPGQRNSYDFASAGSGIVKAVQQVSACRKDDAGSRTMKQFARISGTDYDGSAISVGDSYAMQRRVMDVNPATGTAWTAAQVDAAEFGCKLEA